ncbi:MAG: hypothetical protein EOO16_08750 [Chitinophagaceae bacterium]|nr:MAG: hypothetical protein EOO16_08750 [Chitinophagaceae bacterium]
MSFNPDIHITRANYEEFFLLYTDGELSPEAMEAVDAFTLLHPDLREELDLLLETRLESAPFSFGDPSVLLAESMRRAACEEDLLNYIDGELDAPAARALEARLHSDTALRAEAGLLTAAKLDPADTIECPDKHLLYRREKEERPMIWWRVAAVVLLMTSGVALWQNTRSESESDGTVAVTGRKAPQAQLPDVPARSGVAIPAEENKEDNPATADRINTDNVQPGTQLASAGRKKITSTTATAAAAATEGLAPDQRNRVPAGERLTDRNELPRNERINALDGMERSSQNIGELPVTNEVTLAYNPSDKATQPVATAAVLQTEKPQGSVRGFLRKAARFVEKRTGIRATNDDDQLVVGAVAINLK